MIRALRSRRAVAAAMSVVLGTCLVPRSIMAARPEIDALAGRLTALSRSVAPVEAQRLARAAHSESADLALRYRPVGPPQLHNFLVNAGVKERGLCHHWARDLGERLAQLKLRTLTLRWGIARAGTLREHNAVVVTARGQPFSEGIVLDAWRHSGRLFSGPVAADKYPWREDPHESFAPKPRSNVADRYSAAARRVSR